MPSDKLEWPPPFKTRNGEVLVPGLQLNSDGTLKGYVAGQPFPLLDPNDPQMATKVMWNFSFRPLYTDESILRFPEIASYSRSQRTGNPLSYFTRRPLRVL